MKNGTCQMPREKISSVLELAHRTRGPFASRSSTLRLLAVAMVALGVASGCAAPASVEGVFSEIAIAFEDPRPAMRVDTRGDQVHVMIAEETSTTLTVAQLRLPSTDLSAGDTFAFDVDDASTTTAFLQMTRGDIEVDVLSDGSRVVSSRDNIFAASTGGEVQIDDADGVLAGSFHALLDDGGVIDGRFVIEQ